MGGERGWGNDRHNLKPRTKSWTSYPSANGKVGLAQISVCAGGTGRAPWSSPAFDRAAAQNLLGYVARLLRIQPNHEHHTVEPAGEENATPAEARR